MVVARFQLHYPARGPPNQMCEKQRTLSCALCEPDETGPKFQDGTRLPHVQPVLHVVSLQPRRPHESDLIGAVSPHFTTHCWECSNRFSFSANSSATFRAVSKSQT